MKTHSVGSRFSYSREFECYDSVKKSTEKLNDFNEVSKEQIQEKKVVKSNSPTNIQFFQIWCDITVGQLARKPENKTIFS